MEDQWGKRKQNTLFNVKIALHRLGELRCVDVTLALCGVFAGKQPLTPLDFSTEEAGPFS